MARIRTIKPELWSDEKLAILDPLTRLVFIGLIGMADDAGRLIDNVKSIDGFIFPQTDDTAQDALGILARLARIVRYDADSGQRLIQVVHWERHQKVDRPSKHILPPPSSQMLAAAQDALASTGIRDICTGPTSIPRVTTKDLGPTTNDLTTSSAEAVERRKPDHSLRSCVGLVVQHLYFGSRPNPDAMKTEASIARSLGEHYGYDRLALAIQGLARRRDSGEFPNIGRRQALSLKWLNSKKFDVNQLAASEDAFYAAAPEPRRAQHVKAVGIDQVLASIRPA